MTTVADVDLSTWNRYATSPRLRGSDPFGVNAINVGQAVELNLAQSIATGGLNTPFAITREASRTSGTAPLSVSFVAGFSASDATNTDFHDLYYHWDYGDTGSGTWGTNGKSRNTDSGAIGAHVFESAGTHTVTLTVKDPLTGSTLDTDTFSIVVTAADTTYSGTNTICINNVGDSDFTGKPTGALEVNSDDIGAAMSTHFTDDKRVLLKRGGAWSYSSIVISGNISNSHLGAYGTGTTPDVQGLFSNAPLLTATADTNFVALSFKTNCRFTDLEFTSAGTTGEFFNGPQNVNNNLIMNIKATGASMAVQMSNWRNDDSETIDGNFFVNNNFSGQNGYCFFGGGDGMCIIGSIHLDGATTHTTRIWQIYKGRIAHNLSAGASYANTNGRHALKLHAPVESQIGDFATSGNLGLPNGTAFVHISDNQFGSSPPWPVVIGPQSAGGYDERITDVILERNSYESDLGTFATGVNIQLVYKLSCRFTTVRNNTMNIQTAHSSAGTGINVSLRGAEPTPASIYVYNNTMVSDDTGSWSAVDFTTDSDDCIASNNLVYAPNGTESVVSDSGTGNVLSNNLDTLTTPLVDPFNVTPASRDYSLSGGSGASNTGTSVPVYDDYTGTQRTGTIDVGAYKD